MQTQAEVKTLGIDPDDFCACLSRYLASGLHADGATVIVVYKGIAHAPRRYGVTFKGLHLALQVQVSAADNEAALNAARILFEGFTSHAALKARSFGSYLMTPSHKPAAPSLIPAKRSQGKSIATFDLNAWAARNVATVAAGDGQKVA